MKNMAVALSLACGLSLFPQDPPAQPEAITPPPQAVASPPADPRAEALSKMLVGSTQGNASV